MKNARTINKFSALDCSISNGNSLTTISKWRENFQTLRTAINKIWWNLSHVYSCLFPRDIYSLSSYLWCDCILNFHARHSHFISMSAFVVFFISSTFSAGRSLFDTLHETSDATLLQLSNLASKTLWHVNCTFHPPIYSLLQHFCTHAQLVIFLF